MKKNYLIISILSSLIFLAGFINAQTSVENNWKINDFAADLKIQADGSLAITENITADFDQNPHHGIYRQIPYTYKDENGNDIYTEITGVSVLMDDQSIPYESSENGSYLNLKIGDADKTFIGQHIYTISYVVWGALKSFNAYDELYWDVVGNEWVVPVLNSRAALFLPNVNILQTSCYSGSFGNTNKCSSVGSSTSSAVFNQNSTLQPGESFTIAVGFEKGKIPIINYSNIQKNRQASLPAFAITIGVSLLVGLTLIFRRWFKKGRDFWYGDKGVVSSSDREQLKPFGAKDTIIVQYDPPKDLRVGEVGTIIDETVNTLDISATIVDLAVKGYIHITEIPKEGIFGKTDYELKKVKNPDDSLLDYEKLILCSIFNIPAKNIANLPDFVKVFKILDLEEKESVKISELGKTLGAHLSQIKESLYKDVVSKKYFTQNPFWVRFRYVFLSITMLFVGLFLVIFSFSKFSSPLTNVSVEVGILRGIGIGLAVLAITLFIVGLKAMSQRTALGHQLYREILGYQMFIEHVEKYRQQFFERQNIFMDILPYAMIFKATKKLASALKEMNIKTEQPDWFTGSFAAFSISNFADSMESFSHSLNSAVMSSGSGSGGGGFSGGGGGGGGGGGW